MKNFVAAFLLVLVSNSLCAKVNESEVYYFVKVWGILKYYHPEIQKGKPDWDSAFINGIAAAFENANNDRFLSIEKLIQAAGNPGPGSSGPKLYEQYRNTPYSNLNFDWIFDRQLAITQESKALLKSLVENYRPAANIYIGKEINKYYLNSPIEKFWFSSGYAPDNLHSLLSLARYWNTINYFDPHKKLFDQDWDQTLKEFIPKVLGTASKKEIYLTFASLCAKIDDGHAFYNNYEFDSLMGMHRPAISTSLYERKYNVVTYISPALQKLTGLSKGDVITRLNNKDVSQAREDLREYCRASTEAATQRNIDFMMLKGNIGQRYDIGFTNSNNEVKSTSFIFTEDLKLQAQPMGQESPFREFAAYKAVYIRTPASNSLLKNAFKKASNSGSYLILDLRSGNPNVNWKLIFGKLITDKIHVAKYYKCSFTYPGYFAPEDIYKKRPFSLLTKKFHGKLIVLINEKLQSSLEYNLMIIKTAYPNMVLIGRNTAGADGAATSVLIQYNILAYFTRDVVLFPDGTQTQRKGVAPDMYVEDSLEQFRQGKDAVLEKAFEYIAKQVK
jgi:carboxyl-terminal processing protease